MKKIYVSPELEIKKFSLNDNILSSIESKVNSEIHEMPTDGVIEDL